MGKQRGLSPLKSFQTSQILRKRIFPTVKADSYVDQLFLLFNIVRNLLSPTVVNVKHFLILYYRATVGLKRVKRLRASL